MEPKHSNKEEEISKIGSKAENPKNEKLHVLYTRVSSVGQRTDRQKVSADKYDWLIEDKVSGAVEFFKRPGGKELEDLVNKGLVDTVSIWSIDRAGRNLRDILNTLHLFTKKKIQVEFISQGLKLLDQNGRENPIAKMVISILGVIAEMQRQQIREAQAQGIALAKARGAYEGRVQNSKESVEKFLSKKKNKQALELLERGYKGVEISKILGMSQTTICKVKRLNKLKAD